MTRDLLEYWLRSWRELGLTPPEGAYEEIIARYGEPHRRYHTLTHLSECFAWLDAAVEEAESFGAIGIALWYHDAVYDTRWNDNEARSAALAADVLIAAGASEALTSRIAAMIEATAGHEAATDRDTAFLLDIDLSILGAAPERYEEYRRQIREEYEWVPEEAFAAARAGVLERFLARPALYRMEFFRARLESQARRNLEREIGELKSGSSGGI